MSCVSEVEKLPIIIIIIIIITSFYVLQFNIFVTSVTCNINDSALFLCTRG